MKNILNLACILLVLVFLLNNIAAKSPIDTERLTVVVIEETESRQSLHTDMLSAITSVKWRDYVKSKDGQWRVLDKDADISKDASWVKDCMKIQRTSLPWLIVSDKDTGYSGPFPENIDKMMEIIKR